MAGVVNELSSVSTGNGSFNSNTTVPQPQRNITLAATTWFLDVVHFNYAWCLGLIFVLVFMASTVQFAQSPAESEEPVLLGPGGKPLPRSRKKTKEERERRKQKVFSPGRQLLFNYLSVALLLTFVAHGCNIIIHALVAPEGWWCGKPTAVIHPSRLFQATIS